MKFLLKRNNEFYKFCIIGFLNTFFTYLLYLLLLNFISYRISYTVTYLAGIVFSFVFNAKYVFRAEITFLKFIVYPVVYLVQFLINYFVLYYCVERINIDEKFAAIVVIILAIPITFVLSKFILKD